MIGIIFNRAYIHKINFIIKIKILLNTLRELGMKEKVHKSLILVVSCLSIQAYYNIPLF